MAKITGISKADKLRIKTLKNKLKLEGDKKTLKAIENLEETLEYALFNLNNDILL